MNVNELVDILNTEKPSEELLKREDELFLLIPELVKCKGFNQNSPYHQYDVFEHTMHVVDNTPQNVALRLAALFHDIGKPYTYTEDENGIGHFHNHWVVSQKVFLDFAKKHKLSNEAIAVISNLIFFHDINIPKLSVNEINVLTSKLCRSELIMLFQLKKADILAQSEKNHFMVTELQKQALKLIIKKHQNNK